MDTAHENGGYYNGLRMLDDASAEVDVVDSAGRRSLKIPGMSPNYVWFSMGAGVRSLALLILADAGGDALQYASEFEATVVVHLHGDFDDRFDSSVAEILIERADGTLYTEQWRLPKERVGLWLLERTERGPLSPGEVDGIDTTKPEEWMIENTEVG